MVLQVQARGGPQLVERADNLETQLAIALTEKSEIEAELVSTKAEAAVAEQQHRQLRAG